MDEISFSDYIDLAGYVETRESVEARIREVEDRLARELGISGPDVHEQIVAISTKGELKETRLAHEWYSAYAAWKDWEDEAD